MLLAFPSTSYSTAGTTAILDRWSFLNCGMCRSCQCQPLWGDLGHSRNLESGLSNRYRLPIPFPTQVPFTVAQSIPASQEHTPQILGVSQPFIPSIQGAAALSGKIFPLISKELTMIPRVLTLAETFSIPSPCLEWQDLMPAAPCISLPTHPFGRNWDAGGSGCHQPVPMAGLRSRSSDTCHRRVPPLCSLFPPPSFSQGAVLGSRHW